MAPLPHNNTDIVYVDYQQGTAQHTFQVRVADLADITAIEASIDAFLTAASPLLFETLILAVRGQNSGSTVSFPFPVSGLVGNIYGSGAISNESVPYNINFVGRSTGGRRVRLDLFGYKGAISDWRRTSAESTDVAAAVAELNTATDIYLAVDGLKPFWYPYGNVGANAYWQREQRA